MKINVVGINSKFIHPNLAIRYLKTNCDFPVELFEFSIKDSTELILDQVLENNPDVIAFSVYIWNIEIIKTLLMQIKKKNTDIKIILGGPESSYDSDDLFYEYGVDYIIVGEGELAFNDLLHALHQDIPITSVRNLRYNDSGTIKQTRVLEIEDLDKLKNPYSVSVNDMSHRIAYVELSRGCPYQCAYCLASREKRLRYFSMDRVKDTLRNLYRLGARTFKFLDRTFNANETIAKELLQFVAKKEFHDAVFQFEVNAETMSYEFIEFVNEIAPIDRIRFEIGIQSTNDLVNEAVSRRQNTSKLLSNIKKLKQGNVVMHLDLIAGLPYEDLSSFKNTFNQVFQLYGDELQLGFLKLLKGTKLFYEQEKYHYRVNETAPYEIIDNAYITKQELQIIHIVEETLNIYWNKGFMKSAVKEITKGLDSAFDFFYHLGKQFLKKNKSFHRYQLIDPFMTLEEFVKDINYNYIYNIRYDYLNYHSIKPKIYWQHLENKNDIIRKFHESNPTYNIDSLYKYSVVTCIKDNCILAIYLPDKTEIHNIKA